MMDNERNNNILLKRTIIQKEKKSHGGIRLYIVKRRAEITNDMQIKNV